MSPTKAKTEIMIFGLFRVLLLGGLGLVVVGVLMMDFSGLWAMGCENGRCDDSTFGKMVAVQAIIMLVGTALAWLLDRLLVRGIRRRRVSKG